ncbi:MAG: hypothetical protein QXT86_12690 [Archaeoglobaceae archaeon]
MKNTKRMKNGKKVSLENWARKVSDVIEKITDHVKLSIKENKTISNKFNNFLNTLKVFVNENITEEQAILMLVQYMLTKPIFEVMF